MRLFLALLCLLSIGALAQPPSREHLIGAALEDFGKVAGTWFLNERCGFLSSKERSELELDVAEINTALAADLENPTLLISIQKSARDVAYSESYKSCDSAVRSMFESGVDHTRRWANAIRQIKSRKPRSAS